mmetsp:Transcript_105018/g.266761  ORF Transcript_105018/g.266761 Transcript_105018/m.266761 type:complete len:204 (+) Transcript_105018:1-612(+)
MRDRKGGPCLLRATKSSKLEVIEFLIRQKVDLNAQTKQGNSALHKAAKQSRVEAANLIIKAGADLNIRNEGGATPLMMAAMHKQSDHLLKLLVKAQADVNAQKDVGYTALMVAARYGNGRAVSELIQAKALINVQDKAGETALDKAIKHHKDEVAQILTMSGGSGRLRGQMKLSDSKRAAVTGGSNASGIRRSTRQSTTAPSK